MVAPPDRAGRDGRESLKNVRQAPTSRYLRLTQGEDRHANCLGAVAFCGVTDAQLLPIVRARHGSNEDHGQAELSRECNCRGLRE